MLKQIVETGLQAVQNSAGPGKKINWPLIQLAAFGVAVIAAGMAYYENQKEKKDA